MHTPFERLVLLLLPLLTVASRVQTPLMSASNQQTISDVIARNEDIAIFTGFTRDVATISQRFDSNTQNVTVLAPQNEAIKKLPRKPWEDLQDYSTFGTSAYEGQSGVNRAQENLKRFVEAHIVGDSPWKEGEKVETLGGSTVWYEKRGDIKYVSFGHSTSKRFELTKTSDSTRQY
jgi:uncharacterized surface protein with fasciclin (FAS1) repeats